MAEGAIILNFLYLAVWLVRNLADPTGVALGEILSGVVLPTLSAAAILLSRLSSRQGTLEIGARFAAVAMNGAFIPLVLPSFAVEIWRHFEGTGAELSEIDLRAAAVILLLPVLNIVALLKWLRQDLAEGDDDAGGGPARPPTAA